MTGQRNRRALLNASGVAIVLTLISPAMAHAQDIRGTVSFENGAAIPQGLVKVYLSDPGRQNNAQHGTDLVTLESNGKSTALSFILPSPINQPTSSTLQIVAHLERPDGWLLARGSSKLRLARPAQITLSKVLY